MAKERKPQQRKRKITYSARVVNAICDMVREDTYTQREICQRVGMDETTFGRWKTQHPEFADAIEQAEGERMARLVVEARKSLMKKVTGYDVKEHKTKTVPGKDKDANGKPIPVVKEQTNITKHVESDTTAIIFVLTNGDPDHFKNRHSQEITGPGGEDLFKNKTDEDLVKDIEEMRRKLNMTNEGEETK